MAEAPRVPTVPMCMAVLADSRGLPDKKTVTRWIHAQRTAGVLRPVTRGLYLNNLARPAPHAADDPGEGDLLLPDGARAQSPTRMRGASNETPRTSDRCSDSRLLLNLECNPASAGKVAGTTSFPEVEVPAARCQSKDIAARVDCKPVV